MSKAREVVTVLQARQILKEHQEDRKRRERVNYDVMLPREHAYFLSGLIGESIGGNYEDIAPVVVELDDQTITIADINKSTELVFAKLHRSLELHQNKTEDLHRPISVPLQGRDIDVINGIISSMIVEVEAKEVEDISPLDRLMIINRAYMLAGGPERPSYVEALRLRPS